MDRANGKRGLRKTPICISPTGDGKATEITGKLAVRDWGKPSELKRTGQVWMEPQRVDPASLRKKTEFRPHLNERCWGVREGT